MLQRLVIKSKFFHLCNRTQISRTHSVRAHTQGETPKQTRSQACALSLLSVSIPHIFPLSLLFLPSALHLRAASSSTTLSQSPPQTGHLQQILIMRRSRMHGDQQHKQGAEPQHTSPRPTRQHCLGASRNRTACASRNKDPQGDRQGRVKICSKLFYMARAVRRSPDSEKKRNSFTGITWIQCS